MSLFAPFLTSYSNTRLLRQKRPLLLRRHRHTLLPGANFTISSGLDERYPERHPESELFQNLCVSKETQKRDFLTNRIENLHKHFFRMYDMNMTSEIDAQNKETKKKLKLINLYLSQLKSIEQNLENYHKSLDLQNKDDHLLQTFLNNYSNIKHSHFLRNSKISIREKLIYIDLHDILETESSNVNVGRLYAGGLHQKEDFF